MIKIILISWFISEFEPIQIVLDRFFAFIHLKAPMKLRGLVDYIYTALGCMKCLSFWIGLLTGGFLFALACSFISQIIQLCLQRLK